MERTGRGQGRMFNEILKPRQALMDSEAMIAENVRLRSEASMYRLLLCELSEPALYSDASLNIIYANRAAVTLLSPGPSILGMGLADLFMEEDRGRVAEAFGMAINGAAVSIEPRPVSGGKAVCLRLRPFSGARNDIPGVLVTGSAREVDEPPKGLLKELTSLEELLTARTRELIEANEQLLVEMDAAEKAEGIAKGLEAAHVKLLDSIGDAVLVADGASGRILSANRQAAAMLKYPVDKIAGLHFTDLHPPEITKECVSAFTEALTRGHAPELRVPVRDCDGNLLPVSISAFTLSLEGRTMVYGIFRDLSEAGRREEERRRINLFIDELYRLLLSYRTVRA